MQYVCLNCIDYLHEICENDPDLENIFSVQTRILRSALFGTHVLSYAEYNVFTNINLQSSACHNIIF